MVRGFLDKLAFQVEPIKKTAIVLTTQLRYVDRRGRLFTVPRGVQVRPRFGPEDFQVDRIALESECQSGMPA